MPENEARKPAAPPVRPKQTIRIPGLEPGLIAIRICHGSQVGEQEYELHGKKITRGGRFASSAVIVEAASGWELKLQKGGHYWPEKTQ